MSTLIKKKEDHNPLGLDELLSYFERFSKPKDSLSVGLESEWFPVNPETHETLPFSGKEGIETLLKQLASKFGWKEMVEAERVIALFRGRELISLEPGGQVEYATAPLKTLPEIETSFQKMCQELCQLASENHVKWMSVGFQPVSKSSAIEWVPKARYSIMRKYLGSRGSLAHDMMQRTAATQVSLDYTDETDAMKKMRLGFWVSPFIALLAANSPLKEGKPWDWAVPRVLVWDNTDNDRSGLIERFLGPATGFKDYLDYALDVPMMFIVREGNWIPIGKTFRDFLENGHELFYATLDDFELHLSTLFPEVRLKQFIEMRQADALDFGGALAVASFWKGLLYSSNSLENGLDLFNSVDTGEFLRFRTECAKNGYKSALNGLKTREYVVRLLGLAKEGLKEQGENPLYLEPLEKRTVGSR